MKNALNMLMEERFIYAIGTIVRQKELLESGLIDEIEKKKFWFIDIGCKKEKLANSAMDMVEAINIIKGNIIREKEIREESEGRF